MSENDLYLSQADVDEEFVEKVKKLNSLSNDHLAKNLDIRFISIKKDLVEATMPVNSNVHQPFGILHGGAFVVLAETAASVAAWLQVDTDKYNVVGIEINANHLRSVRTGLLTAKARPVKVGRQIQVWNIDIFNEEGKQACVSRCTLMSIKK